MPATSKTILLVEDDALVTLLEKRQLEELGYAIVLASSGEQAIEKTRAAQPPLDLILMDINLGRGLDGTQAAQIILQDHDIPVVFLSSHTERQVVEKTEKITSYGYVVKDSGIIVLDASIKMAFKLHAAQQTIQRANDSLRQEIAERKRAEERLETSQANLEKAEKISGLGYWEWNIQTNELNWSEGVYRLYGLDPLKDKPTYDVVVQTVAPEYREQFVSAVENAVKHDAPFEGEYRMIDLNGREHYTYTIGEVIHDHAGRPISMFGVVQDITERKRIEEALRSNEERYRIISDMTSDYSFCLRIEETGQVVNEWTTESFARLTGYSIEEVLEKGWDMLYHPDDRAQAALLARQLFEGRPQQSVLRIITKQGEIRWLSSTVKPVFDQTLGRVVRLIGAGRDVTESRRAEEALRESEALLRQVVRYDPFAISVHDNDMRYIAASEHWLHDYGVKEDDIIGKSHYDVFPEIPQRWKDVHQRCLAGAVERNDDDYFERLDGSITYNRWEMRPWYRLDGTIGGAISYTEVTTERKQLEMARKAIIERYNLATRAAGFGVWDWDIQKDDLIWDDRMYELYGVKREDFSGAHEAWLACLHPDDREASEQVSREARLGKREYDTEFRIVWPTGEIRALKAYGQVIWDSDGNPIRMTGINYDITERKQVEAALRESEANYRQLFENMTSGFVLLQAVTDDRQHVIDFRYVEVNPATQRITGLKAEDMVNRTLLQVLGDKVHTPTLDVYRQVLALGEGITTEIYTPFLNKHVELRIFRARADQIAVLYNDITGRKQAEEQLRQREAQLKTVMENTPDTILWVDRAGLISFVNHLVPGLTEQEVIGSSVYQWVPQEQHPILARTFEAVFSTGESGEYQSLGPGPHGQPRIYHVRVMPVTIDGKTDSAIFTATDITERKQAEDKLRESEAKYKAMVHNIPGMVYRADPDWRAEIISGAESLCDYTSDEINSMPRGWLDIVHPDDRDVVERQGALLVHERRELVQLYRIMSKNGQTRWVEDRKLSLFSESGVFEGIEGIALDITQRKQMEESLRASERLLREIAANYPHSYISIIEKDLTVGFTSGQEFQKQGLDPHGFVGLTLEQVFGEHTPVVREHYLQAFGGSETEFELFLNNQHQLYRVAPLVDAHGQVERILVVVENITARKQAEEALQQALADKETLLHELRHRVKNSLTTAISLIRLEQASLEQASLPDDRARAVLANTQARLRTMADLYSQLDQGGRVDRIDMRQYLDTLVRMLAQAYLVEASPVKIETRLAELELAPEQAMPLGLIVNELVTNALKHAFPAGRPGVIRVELEAGAEGATLCVADDGVGLSPARPRDSDSGLGLMLVEMLAGQLDGQLTVEGAPGVTVRVTFGKSS